MQHNHISTLVTHLESIRRQYLSISPPAGSKGKAKERGFTEQERDEVDLQAKILLKRCLERILVLEREEEEGTAGKKAKGKGELDVSRIGTGRGPAARPGILGPKRV